MTLRHYRHDGQRHIWQSRDHRRGLRRAFRPLEEAAWRPERLNNAIGLGFATGSLLFVAGSLLSARPGLATAMSVTETEINAVFFVGSIFFTVAAWLQLFQAANSGTPAAMEAPASRRVLIGWKPNDIGWLSSFLQFIGTLLFNVNTMMAMGGTGNWLRQDLTVWVPDLFGSILFLLSGYLAFIEAGHRYLSWTPSDLSWWVVAVNLAGCVAFMVSAIYAFVPSAGASDHQVHLSVMWTLWGAVGFLVGSGLMLLEGAATRSSA